MYADVFWAHSHLSTPQREFNKGLGNYQQFSPHQLSHILMSDPVKSELKEMAIECGWMEQIEVHTTERDFGPKQDLKVCLCRVVSIKLNGSLNSLIATPPREEELVQLLIQESCSWLILRCKTSAQSPQSQSVGAKWTAPAEANNGKLIAVWARTQPRNNNHRQPRGRGEDVHYRWCWKFLVKQLTLNTVFI